MTAVMLVMVGDVGDVDDGMGWAARLQREANGKPRDNEGRKVAKMSAQLQSQSQSQSKSE